MEAAAKSGDEVRLTSLALASARRSLNPAPVMEEIRLGATHTTL